MIEEGAETVNIKNDENKTMLHWAVLQGDTKVIKVLLKKNAEVNGVDTYGNTALHYACGPTWNQQVVKYLIEGRAKVNLKNEGKTPLHQAAERSHTGLIEALLKR